MRPMNVNQVKRGVRRDTRQQAPREGSKLRALWDRLMDGEEVTGAELNKSNARAQLQDFYGLEFRQRGKGVYFLYLS